MMHSKVNISSGDPNQYGVGDPNASYESLKDLWSRARAILNGQSEAKAYDEIIDRINYRNLLLPFSPQMSQQQYNFYVAEAELPGLISQYAKILAGGLLRKAPAVEFKQEVPAEASDWLSHEFTSDGRTMIGFLDNALWEELSTSRCWVTVDYPSVDTTNLSAEERKSVRPFPTVWKAEQVINWRSGVHPETKLPTLMRVVFRYTANKYTASNPYHPTPVETAADHYLDEAGNYSIDYYELREETQKRVESGKVVSDVKRGGTSEWVQVGGTVQPMMNGEFIKEILAFPLNGSVEPRSPILQPLVDREIALYNKISRRNHLLLGAATYTPYVASDMSSEEFSSIVSAGLGSWVHIGANDKLGALETPTDALADMNSAIESSISEMSRMGIRMLSPETGESGVALEIRNSAQTAQLGTLNTKISEMMRTIIAHMVNWRYGTSLKDSDVVFTLSSDFNPAPIGSEWIRLMGEYYKERLIPRSSFLATLKENDLLPPDYDDEVAQEEINRDGLIPEAPGGLDLPEGGF